MTSRFARLGRWAIGHRYAALTAWVAALVLVTAGAQAVGPDWQNDFTLPGTETQRVNDLLDAHAPDRAGDEVQVVVHSAGGLDERRVDGVLDRVREAASVATVDELVRSPDGRTGLATVTLTGRSTDVPVEDVREIISAAQAGAGDGLRVEVGGDPVREADEGEGGAAEGAGVMAALVILVLLFGSFLAAAMPVVIALFAVGVASGLVVLASHVFTIANFTTAVMALVGLGVGIDYALLVFSRFRSELLAGRDRSEATLVALDTAGRTIFFAGLTVIVALLGLVLLGLGSLQGVAVAVALTVAATMVAALTLLPALLALFGPRLERRLRRRAERRGDREGERWRRWTAVVQRRPWPIAVVATAFLLVLAVPALDMRLGFADAGTDAPSSTSRQAYELTAAAFGPGSAGPLIVVNEGASASDAALTRALEGASGVARVTPPVRSPDGAISTSLAFPESAPQSEATTALVDRLRADLPDGAAIGGATAAAVDFSDAVAGKLVLFVGTVVGVSALLLLLVFRSLWIPVKAALLNLLSVGAALGVLTWVFGAGNLGAQPGPVEAFIPVMTFAIVFGLSMDYEVFLLSRMHEEWERHRDARRAVAEGLATTGRVVTAAAAIMVLVFGSFLLSPSRMLQQMGLGMAVAVLLDAVVVRCLLVPAIMQLLGERAWWLPAPLARRLPRVALESGS